MIAFMPQESANSSPGMNYWYGTGLPTGLEGVLSQDESNARMMRRASGAEENVHANQSHGPTHWDRTQAGLHLDAPHLSTLVIRPQSSAAVEASTAVAAASAAHKAPLAPKQGLGGTLGSSRVQQQSPVSGTYALRTPRGKITSIACESCRKRKSKCDGVRPKCNTCQSKNLSCVYDVAEDGKTTTQLRAHVRRLAKELDDMKSIVSLLTMAPDRTIAATWANELEKNGFAHHTADEIKNSLQDAHEQQHRQGDHDGSGSPGSEHYPQQVPSLATSSYDGSSRDESREQSQPSLGFRTETIIDGVVPFNFNNSGEVAKFNFDCAVYRRTKREMLANGWDEGQIFGRNDVDVDTILLGFIDPQDAQAVPTWASRMVNKILLAAPLSVRLASTFLLTRMMRWLIWPSVENMNDMPEWLMPLARPEGAPFDLLIDLLPWPQIRQYLFQHPDQFVDGSFVGFVTLAWPYADDACHYWDIETGCTRMTPLFESCIKDLGSWTLDAKALEIMPQLEGMVPLKVV